MGQHPRKTTVTLSLRHVTRRLNYYDVHCMVRDYLHVHLDQIIAIHLDAMKNMVFLKLNREELAERVAAALPNGFLWTDPETGKQHLVPVSLETGLQLVRVHQVPIEVPNALIASALAVYGIVVGNVINETFGAHMPFPGVYSGVRSVRMKIQKPIPSSIVVDGEKTLVTYNGQTKTCMRCGSTSHLRAECASTAPRSTPAQNRVRTMADAVGGRFASEAPLQMQKLAGSTTERRNEPPEPQVVIDTAEIHTPPSSLVTSHNVSEDQTEEVEISEQGEGGSWYSASEDNLNISSFPSQSTQDDSSIINDSVMYDPKDFPALQDSKDVRTLSKRRKDKKNSSRSPSPRPKEKKPHQENPKPADSATHQVNQ